MPAITGRASPCADALRLLLCAGPSVVVVSGGASTWPGRRRLGLSGGCIAAPVAGVVGPEEPAQPPELIGGQRRRGGQLACDVLSQPLGVQVGTLPRVSRDGSSRV